jgi:hypothetical protein
MVSQETVTQLEGQMNGMKEEMTRLESIHRQLLLRYTTLKYIIDIAFGKWNYSTSGNCHCFSLFFQSMLIFMVR